MDECIHGLSACATCAGTDTRTVARGPESNFTTPIPWSLHDIAVARDASKTSAEVGRILGRSTNQVSAMRVNRLRMSGYAGYTAKPHAH